MADILKNRQKNHGKASAGRAETGKTSGKRSEAN
jgi:hypothetical protein